jgi:hypothetical protein
MATTKTHLITAQCFVNGIVNKLNYTEDKIRFINSEILVPVLNNLQNKLTKYDLTGSLKRAIVYDESSFISQYGIILPLPAVINEISNLMINLTISYIWKSNNDIEFYIDNVKEPYTIHNSAIIKYLDNVDFDPEANHNIVFDLKNTGNFEHPYYQFYDLLAEKIDRGEIIDSPLTLNNKKIGKIQFMSDSR